MSYEKDFLNIQKIENEIGNCCFFLKLNLLVFKSTGSIPYTKHVFILLCETLKNFFKACTCGSFILAIISVKVAPTSSLRA